MEMQVINISKTKTSTANNLGIFVYLRDTVYIYFKASFVSSLLLGFSPSTYW